MTLKKRESEGIALLSMYADDDEDDIERPPHLNDAVSQPQNDDFAATITKDRVFNHDSSIFTENIQFTAAISPIFTENSTPKAVSNTMTPRGGEVDFSRKERLTIVDYGHDEAALSPEAEEGEMDETGRVMFGADLHMCNGEFSEQTSQGTVRGVTPNHQATPQSYGQHGESQPEAMDYTATELVEVPEIVEVGTKEPKDVHLALQYQMKRL